MLQAPKEPLYFVAIRIQVRIIGPLHLPVALRRDHRLGFAGLDEGHKRITIIPLIGNDGFDRIRLNERLSLRDVGPLPWRYDESERIAEGINRRVELRRETAPAAPKCLSISRRFFDRRRAGVL